MAEYTHSQSDFEFEPVRGLPGPLPAGEKVLWQGGPSFLALAFGVFHVRKVAVYFGLLIAWRAFRGMGDGQAMGEAWLGALAVLPLAVVGIGVLLLLAWGYHRTSVYTLTTRRFVLRSGIALPVTVNLPYSWISKAGLKVGRNGHGDILLEIAAEDRLAPLLLWPHMRPWRWARPQPMMRGIANAERVAKTLAEALEGRDVAPLQADAALGKAISTATSDPGGVPPRAAHA